MNFFGMGFMEVLFILLLALLLLGPTKMVETARTLGRYMREFQRAASELPRMLSLEDDEEEKEKARSVERRQVQTQEEPEPQDDDRPVPRR